MMWEGCGYLGLRTKSGSPALSLTSCTIYDESPKLLKLRDNVKIIIITNTTWRTKGRMVQRHTQNLSGGRYAHYLASDDGFTGVYIHQNSTDPML